MKRSEMIEIISEYLFSQPFSEYGLRDLARNDARQILTLIEQKGMLPPTIYEKVADNNIGCIEEGYVEFERNKWEEE